jgi:hypothetical protein
MGLGTAVPNVKLKLSTPDANRLIETLQKNRTSLDVATADSTAKAQVEFLDTTISTLQAAVKAAADAEAKPAATATGEATVAAVASTPAE